MSEIPTCACCASPFPTGHGMGRRGMLGLAAGLLGVATLGRGAQASDGSVYDSMLLTCIDPRFVTPAAKWMDGQHLNGKYSHFSFAGASVGVVAPSFVSWAPAFWDNLATSIQLHGIKRVMVVNHRDCGAAKIAYGAAAVATPELETALHRKVFAEFTGQLAQRQPKMGIGGGLMALDGTLISLS